MNKMYDIYFSAYEYANATNHNASLDFIKSQFAMRHHITSKIFINIKKLLNDYHYVFNNCTFDEKLNICISHEILHDILAKHMSIYSQFDNLTASYWKKNIDINTNLEIKTKGV